MNRRPLRYRLSLLLLLCLCFLPVYQSLGNQGRPAALSGKAVRDQSPNLHNETNLSTTVNEAFFLLGTPAHYQKPYMCHGTDNIAAIISDGFIKPSISANYDGSRAVCFLRGNNALMGASTYAISRLQQTKRIIMGQRHAEFLDITNSLFDRVPAILGFAQDSRTAFGWYVPDEPDEGAIIGKEYPLFGDPNTGLQEIIFRSVNDMQKTCDMLKKAQQLNRFISNITRNNVHISIHPFNSAQTVNRFDQRQFINPNILPQLLEVPTPLCHRNNSHHYGADQKVDILTQKVR